MGNYITKALYLGTPETAEKLLSDIESVRGSRTFAQFVVEAIKEKIIKEKTN